MHIFKEHKNEYIKTINQKLINNLRTSRLIKKNDDVLDFGCGIGIWDSEKSTSVFFHDLYLYDENIEKLEFCKKKYPHYNILNNLNDNLHVNVIFVNSVIQYINTNDLEKLFDKFASILKNDCAPPKCIRKPVHISSKISNVFFCFVNFLIFSKNLFIGKSKIIGSIITAATSESRLSAKYSKLL